MEIGPNFKNILSYNENMAKGMEDKLFFLNELPKNQEYTFVDFGCADGTLINYLVGIYNNYYTNTYIGYDISDTMIELAKTNFNGGAKNVHFTSDWKDVVKNLSEQPIYRKKVLILSSVIHEVYSYAQSNDDITSFWDKVLNSNFDYICVRDMMIPESYNYTETPELWNDMIHDSYRRIMTNERFIQFEEKWGQIKYRKAVALHFLLKYRWQINWDREVNENYFPIYIEQFLHKFESNYNLDYFVRFCVPFIKDAIDRDFYIRLGDTDFTHIKAIFSHE